MKETKKIRITKHCIPGVILQPKDGYWQVRQVGLTAKRVKTDPAFKRTRQQAKELAQAAKAGKLLSDALLPGTGIRKIWPRLIPLTRKAIQADTAGIVGNRNFLKADWSVLQGFECNSETPFNTAVHVMPAIQWLHEKQQVVVSMPPFKPADNIYPPEGIGYCRIYTLYACIDMQSNNTTVKKCRSTLVPYKPISIQLKPFMTALNNEQNKVHLLAMGVEWYANNSGNGTIVRSRIPGSITINALWVT